MYPEKVKPKIFKALGYLNDYIISKKNYQQTKDEIVKSDQEAYYIP
jgi:hypothetical protein